VLAQPLVRSTARYLCQLRGRPGATFPPEMIAAEEPTGRVPLLRRYEAAYWGEGWQERTHLVGQFVRLLDACNFARVLDSGWTDWDVEASVGPWAKVRVRTVEEDHGGGHRLVRVRYDLLPTLFARSVAAAAAARGALGGDEQRAARHRMSIVGLGGVWLGLAASGSVPVAPSSASSTRRHTI
jgi:hypothetical protein